MLCSILLFILLQVNPLNIPVSLSGSYGELRSGRFHAGVDLRVGGKVGDEVHSVCDGYISRVSVSPTGYGNGIYVTHSDGRECVYGHMLKFTQNIALLVREAQYASRSFPVNLFFDKDELPVKMGDVIGYVGNSGSSGGPHLHFEVRSANGTMPINPFVSGYIKSERADNVPPVINRVNFYSFEDSSGVVESSIIKSASTSRNETISLSEKSYISIDAVDYQEGTPAKLGVEEYLIKLDDKVLYNLKLGNYSYEEQLGFNSLIDYKEKVVSERNMIKSYIEPGNTFKHRIEYVNNGIIELKDDNIHTLSVIVKDLAGNKSTKNFKIKRGYKNASDSSYINGGCLTPRNLPLYYSRDGLSLSLSPSSLFNSIIFKVDSIPASNFMETKYPVLSKIWKIGSKDIPIKNGGCIIIEANLPQSLREKCTLATISDKGILSYCGGEFKNGKVIADFYTFGDYCVTIDTIPPTIKRVGNLSFIIRDDFSGIKEYVCKLDGEWVLSTYDAKYNKLRVVIDNKKNITKNNHSLEVIVTDYKNNTVKEKYLLK